MSSRIPPTDYSHVRLDDVTGEVRLMQPKERPDFAEVRRICNGMMRAEVYEAIYDAARVAPGTSFVEVGTGHGAATVCLARALQDTGREAGKIYTFDKFQGGSRKRYGDLNRNLEITIAALEHFGVRQNVELVVGDAAQVQVPIDEEEIGLMMLDCDGRIDRDFATFYDRVSVGGAIIVDDKANRVRVIEKEGSVRVDQKHRITDLLTRSAREHGLIGRPSSVHQTWFYTKRARRFADWPHEAILGAYRELVFATGEIA